VTDITHAGKRAAAPDAPEHFDNRSATFSVISVSPSFRLADRKFPRLDSPFLPCLIDIRAGFETISKKRKLSSKGCFAKNNWRVLSREVYKGRV
jgi:hypothetical protein